MVGKGKNLVICPVYNESDTIVHFFKELRRHYRGDCLFIDDGSTDESKAFLDRIRDENLFIVKEPVRSGYGRTLRRGFDFARRRNYAKVITIDADLQHLPHHLPAFLDELNRYPVVLGSRYIRLQHCLDIPRSRMLINRYISRLLKLLFLTSFSDPFCGLRGYRASFLRQSRLEESSYGFCLEIIMEIIRTRTAFREIPIEAIYPDHSREFLDGLHQPRERLLHYLEVISRKRREIMNNDEIRMTNDESMTKFE